MTGDIISMTQASKVESITIISGKRLSPLERARYKISEEEFIEVRIIKNSPKKLEIKAIKKGVKPTEGFRNAIKNAELLDYKFD